MRFGTQSRSAPELLLLLLLIALLSLTAGVGHTFTAGQNANKVIGEADYASMINPQYGLRTSGNIIFDNSGNLWVADADNNRVVEFRPPFSNGTNFSLVLGQSTAGSFVVTTQSSLYNPSGMAFDSSGNLWIADVEGNRVLEFKAPFSNGMPASLVLGQSLFTSSAFSSTENDLYIPQGLTFDFAGNLWIADAANSRVVEFKPPFSTGMSEASVLGQPGFNSGTTATSQSGLRYPAGIAFDSSGNLWVSDKGNNRLLEFLGSLATSTSTSSQTSTSTSVTSSSTSSTTTSTVTSNTSTTASNVPEFPVGLPVVFAAVLMTALLSYSYLRRRPIW